jgi:hypothetical protein
LQRIELHPDALADFRAFHELHLAAARREIEDPDPKVAAAAAADSGLGG